MFGSGDSEEVEKRYTEHEAVVVYANGDEERTTFDESNVRDGYIVLYDYVGLKSAGMSGVMFERKKVVTISMHNLRKIETVGRTERSITDEV